MSSARPRSSRSTTTSSMSPPTAARRRRRSCSSTCCTTSRCCRPPTPPMRRGRRPAHAPLRKRRARGSRWSRRAPRSLTRWRPRRLRMGWTAWRPAQWVRSVSAAAQPVRGPFVPAPTATAPRMAQQRRRHAHSVAPRRAGRAVPLRATAPSSRRCGRQRRYFRKGRHQGGRRSACAARCASARTAALWRARRLRAPARLRPPRTV